MVKFKQFLFRVIIKTNSRYDYIYIYFPIAFMYYKSTVCKKVIFYFKSSFEKHELHLLAARKIVCPPLRTNTNDTLILTSHTGYTCKFILIYIYIYISIYPNVVDRIVPERFICILYSGICAILHHSPKRFIAVQRGSVRLVATTIYGIPRTEQFLKTVSKL